MEQQQKKHVGDFMRMCGNMWFRSILIGMVFREVTAANATDKSALNHAWHWTPGLRSKLPIVTIVFELDEDED